MSSYYRFLPKGSSLESFKTISNSNFAESSYGDVISSNYPFSSSIDIKYYKQNNTLLNDRPHIFSLKNTLNNYTYYSNHYSFKSELGDKSKQALKLISIPSIFYGSSIDKGSVELEFFISGTLLAKLQDTKKNGELIQTYGSNGLNQIAGVVLYNEGFIVLTGSWDLTTNFSETYIYSPNTVDYPKWIYWGSGLRETNNLTVSSSFDLKFEGINYVNVLTMMAHAEKGELNFSNNPTYLSYNSISESSPVVTSTQYSENSNLTIKNIKKYNYENFTGELEKQTYISKIGIFDENKNLIAIAKLSKPIKKTENRDLTFKLKLDI